MENDATRDSLSNPPLREKLLRVAPWLMLLTTFVAYSGTLHHAFVYDDEAQIVTNNQIKNWRYIPGYFNSQVWGFINPMARGNYFRPVFLIWLWLNHAVFDLNPFGWHLAASLAHLAATYLVYRLALVLTGDNFVAIAGGFFFGLYPVHVEAVAWISGVTESLFLIPFVSSLLLYIEADKKGQPSAHYWGSLGLFAVALLTKETAFALPVFLFLYELLFPELSIGSPLIGRIPSLRKALIPILPFLLLLALYLPVRLHALHGFSFAVTDLSKETVLLTIPSVLLFYLRLLILPVNLSAFYDTPYVQVASFARFWWPLLIVLITLGCCVYLLKRTNSAVGFFLFAWIVLPIIPVLNFSVFGEGEIAHDRYLYLPSVGFCILLAYILRGLTRRTGPSGLQPVSILAAVVIAGSYFIGTLGQTVYWANDLVLYYRGVQIAPNNDLARNNFANALTDRGKHAEAIREYQHVLNKNPNFWLSNYNLGYAFFREGDYQKAEYFLRRATSMHVLDADQFYYLGLVEQRLGNQAAAEQSLRIAIATDGRRLNFRSTLAALLEGQGRTQEALELYQAEAAWNPKDKITAEKILQLQSIVSGSQAGAKK